MDLATLQKLHIWKFLGEQMQSAISQKFEQFTDERKQTLISSLNALEESYVDIVGKADEATFVYLLQEALVGMVDDLMREVKDVEKDYFRVKEATEREAEAEILENTLAEL